MKHTLLEKEEIQKSFDNLLNLAKRSQSVEEQNLIKKAFSLANEAHIHMRRKSGEPYIFHPIEVATIIADEIGLGTTSIICSLLHDVVEDTDYTLHDIEKIFNKKSANIIDGLTKIENKIDSSSTYKDLNKAETLRKVLMTLSDDIRVIFIKLADRLHNMRTLDSMKKLKQIRISSETLHLYAPLAHRLGLYSIKTELEDLCLKYMETESYINISDKIQFNEKKRMGFIRKFSLPLMNVLDKYDIKYDIDGRPKSIFSVWNKMKNKDISFEEIYDLLAVRIIFEPKAKSTEREECWQIYAIISEIYKPKPNRLRDWILTPKANGYEALHTTVMGPEGRWIEIQIRTKRMNEIAEKGYAAHWKYKGINDKESELDKWIKQVRMSLENPSKNALEFLDEFKFNLFTSEISVFTPNGEVKTLRNDATVLDFAFEIHTEIACKAVGAKVNHELVSLKTKLKHGDQIEIITSKQQKPLRKWLNFVKTSKARLALNNVFKSDRNKHIDIGKHILQKKMKEELNIALIPEVFKTILRIYSFKVKDDFYFALGTGETDLMSLGKYLKKEQENNKTVSYWKLQIQKVFGKNKKQETKNIQKEASKQNGALLVNDLENTEYILSNCCNPIVGEDVLAYRSENGKIIVHKKMCLEAIKMITNYSLTPIDVRWINKKINSFLVKIEIKGIDKLGLVRDITELISKELAVNIKAISLDSDDGVFFGTISLYVASRKNLKNAMTNLLKIKEVNNVKQIDI